MIAIVRAGSQGVALQSSQLAGVLEERFDNTSVRLVIFPGGQLVQHQPNNLLFDDMWMVQLSLRATRLGPR